MSELSPAAGVLVTESTTAKPESEPNVHVETDPRSACLRKAMLCPVAWATSALVSSAQAAVAAPVPAVVVAEDPLPPDLEQAPSRRTHSAAGTARCRPARAPDESIRPPSDLDRAGPAGRRPR